MNYSRIFIAITELVCLTITSLCGMAAFTNSNLYSGINNYLIRMIPSICDHFHLIIFLSLLLPGIVLIIWKNKSPGPLTIAALVLSLPSLLSFNQIDLFKIFRSGALIASEFSLFQMLSSGLLIITAYFLLDLLNQLKLGKLQNKIHQPPSSDIQFVLNHQHIMIIIFTGSALLIGLIISGVARSLEYLISKGTPVFEWWIMPAVLAVIFLLGIYLYWITTRKNV